jgi:hypothetical protein
LIRIGYVGYFGFLDGTVRDGFDRILEKAPASLHAALGRPWWPGVLWFITDVFVLSILIALAAMLAFPKRKKLKV